MGDRLDAEQSDAEQSGQNFAEPLPAFGNAVADIGLDRDNSGAAECVHLTDPVQYEYYQLWNATEGFTYPVVRQDAFSWVYWGFIYSISGTKSELLAIQLLNTRRDIDPEFMDELDMLTKRRHRNLISLVGYCREKGMEFFVFDLIGYSSNLHSMIHGERKLNLPPLTWKERLDIAFCVARALDFLHRQADPAYVYEYVNAGNVLISKIMGRVKLADIWNFEEPEFYEDEDGYLAPEYIPENKTFKTDVYSFGVLLLVLMTGQKAHDENRPGSLPALLTDAIGPPLGSKRRIQWLMDPELRMNWSAACVDKVGKLARQCLKDQPRLRPTMEELALGLQEAVSLQANYERSVGESSRAAAAAAAASTRYS